jgi:hypothetical protein
MDKIKRVARRFRILFQVLFYLAPIAVVWFWLSVHTSFDIFSNVGVGAQFFTWKVTLNGTTRFLAIIVSIVPMSISMYAMHQLVKIFRHYEQGDVFSVENANRYQKLAYALFAWVIGGLFYSMVMSFVMTFQNTGFKQKVVAVSFGSYDLMALITGGIVLLIAWVMKEAQKISEDQSLTV